MVPSKKTFLTGEAVVLLVLFGTLAYGQGNWEDNAALPRAWTTGNVGIGLAAPLTRLHVEGGSSRFGGAANYGQFDLNGNLRFFGTSRYLVPGNTHAFKSPNNNIGLYFNSANNRLEFTNSAGVRMFSTDIAGANAGDGYFNRSLTVASTVTAGAFVGDGSGLTNLPMASQLWTLSGADIYFDTGNVGVGSSNPLVRLNVDGGTDVEAGTPNSGFFVIGSPSGQHLTFDANELMSKASETTTSTLHFQNDGGNSSFGGNVGIGTSSPSHTLHVVGGANVMSRIPGQIAPVGLNSVFQFSDNEIASGVGIGFAHSTNPVNIGAAIVHERVAGESQGKLHFATKRNTVTGGDIPISMTIDDFGRVGIGTTTPTEDLDIVDNDFADIEMIATDTTPDVQMFIDARGDGRGFDQGQVGTRSNHGMMLFTNSLSRMTITAAGDVGIGTFTPQSKLAVNGKITATEVEVTLDGWSDFVFESDYFLMPLDEVERHIHQYKHLPGIPSEEEVRTNGVNLGEMQSKLLQKIEELTLHVIRLQKHIDDLENGGSANR